MKYFLKQRLVKGRSYKIYHGAVEWIPRDIIFSDFLSFLVPSFLKSAERKRLGNRISEELKRSLDIISQDLICEYILKHDFKKESVVQMNTNSFAFAYPEYVMYVPQKIYYEECKKCGLRLLTDNVQ